MSNLLRSRITTLVLVVFCGWLGILALGSLHRHRAAEAEVARLNEQMENEHRDNARITRELERMKAPAWLALLARQQLNYRQPDESVAFVYKTEKVATIVPQSQIVDTRSSWQKWLDWFRRK